MKRAVPLVMKGIPTDQEIPGLPTADLQTDDSYAIPAIIGHRMAQSNNLAIGDQVTIRWRDVHGTFDATSVEITQIFSSDAESVDAGQIWLPLESLQTMLDSPNSASVFVLAEPMENTPNATGWIHRDLDFLLKDMMPVHEHAFMSPAENCII